MTKKNASQSGKRACLCIDFAVVGYQQARSLQQRLVDLKRQSRNTADFIILLEHPPVFTLGRNAGRDNLKVSEAFLASKEIPLVRVERGGDITYHGPGQLVGYPIVDLTGAGISVADYVQGLEEVMILTVAEWGIGAKRSPVNRGIWSGDRKLGSIGIAVRRGISFHGFALNVNTDLKPFGWINPCGLPQFDVTSMAKELSADISMPKVRRTIRKYMQAVFDLELKDVKPDLFRTNGPQNDFLFLERSMI